MLPRLSWYALHFYGLINIHCLACTSIIKTVSGHWIAFGDLPCPPTTHKNNSWRLSWFLTRIYLANYAYRSNAFGPVRQSQTSHKSLELKLVRLLQTAPFLARARVFIHYRQQIPNEDDAVLAPRCQQRAIRGEADFLHLGRPRQRYGCTRGTGSGSGSVGKVCDVGYCRILSDTCWPAPAACCPGSKHVLLPPLPPAKIKKSEQN